MINKSFEPLFDYYKKKGIFEYEVTKKPRPRISKWRSHTTYGSGVYRNILDISISALSTSRLVASECWRTLKET